MPALSAMTVIANTLDPTVLFPPGLTELELRVSDGLFSDAPLQPLTHVQKLQIVVNKESTPVDLSGSRR